MTEADNDRGLAILEGVVIRWDNEVAQARAALERAEHNRESARRALEYYEEQR